MGKGTTAKWNSAGKASLRVFGKTCNWLGLAPICPLGWHPPATSVCISYHVSTSDSHDRYKLREIRPLASRSQLKPEQNDWRCRSFCSDCEHRQSWSWLTCMCSVDSGQWLNFNQRDRIESCVLIIQLDCSRIMLIIIRPDPDQSPSRRLDFATVSCLPWWCVLAHKTRLWLRNSGVDRAHDSRACGRPFNFVVEWPSHWSCNCSSIAVHPSIVSTSVDWSLILAPSSACGWLAWRRQLNRRAAKLPSPPLKGLSSSSWQTEIELELGSIWSKKRKVSTKRILLFLWSSICLPNPSDSADFFSFFKIHSKGHNKTEPNPTEMAIVQKSSRSLTPATSRGILLNWMVFFNHNGSCCANKHSQSTIPEILWLANWIHGSQ